MKDGISYIILFDAELGGYQKRASQVSIIGSGFKILAVPETDLSQVRPLTITAAITAPLETFIQTYMEQFKVPGAVVGIVQNGELVYAEGFGVANPETGAAMTPDTHMMIGSTGKSLTTLLMATLVDDGLMTWDTPVVDIYPSFKLNDPELTQNVTMRNLVCACTGIPRRDFELLFNADETSPAELVESLADFAFFTKYDEAFQYSNQMVGAAGYIAGALASGNSGDLLADYADALQERVLDPIGMTGTTLSLDAVKEQGDNATPHAMKLDSTYSPLAVDMEGMLAPTAPAGAHWSTLHDMAKYMIMQLNEGVAPDGTRVVSAENLLETRKPGIAVAADTTYGLGWLVSKYKGQPYVSHGGNTMGFTTAFGFLPEADLGIIVLTNAQASNLFNEGVVGRLFELVFNQEPETQRQLDFYLEQIKQQTDELMQQIGDTVDAAAVEPYLGEFTNDALGKIDVSMEDGKLMLDAGEFRTQLLPYSDKEGELQGYIQTDPPLQGAVYRLEEDADGAPVIVLGRAAVEYTFTKAQ